jgi:hypothetical protein
MNFFQPFYFDANEWFGVIASDEDWLSLVDDYRSEGCELDILLGARMAPKDQIEQLPTYYHLDAPLVRTGEMPSFGFRREHLEGVIRLEDWARERGVDLRAIAGPHRAVKRVR